LAFPAVGPARPVVDTIATRPADDDRSAGRKARVVFRRVVTILASSQR